MSTLTPIEITPELNQASRLALSLPESPRVAALPPTTASPHGRLRVRLPSESSRRPLEVFRSLLSAGWPPGVGLTLTTAAEG